MRKKNSKAYVALLLLDTTIVELDNSKMILQLHIIPIYFDIWVPAFAHLSIKLHVGQHMNFTFLLLTISSCTF